MPLDLGNRLYARPRVGDDASPIGIGLAIRSAESGDRLGLRHLMGEHITERSEFANFELAVTHRLDLSIVAGRDKDLDLAAELVADQLSDFSGRSAPNEPPCHRAQRRNARCRHSGSRRPSPSWTGRSPVPMPSHQL